MSSGLAGSRRTMVGFAASMPPRTTSIFPGPEAGNRSQQFLKIARFELRFGPFGTSEAVLSWTTSDAPGPGAGNGLRHDHERSCSCPCSP